MKRTRDEDEKKRAEARRRSAEAEAEAMDDPAGPPEPAGDSVLGSVGKAMTAVGLAGIGFMALVSAFPMRTAGATASARLEWRRRRQAMAEAALQARGAEARGARTGEEGNRSQRGPRDEGDSRDRAEAADDE